MPDLNVTKILVILVVALVVLGPDKLPKAARQAAGFYNDVRRFRESLNSEVREAFGDLGTISTLPTRPRTWARSFTSDMLKEMPPDPTAEPPPGRGGAPSPATWPGSNGDGEGELDVTFN